MDVLGERGMHLIQKNGIHQQYRIARRYAFAGVAGERRPSWSPRRDPSHSLVLLNLIRTSSYVAPTEVLVSEMTAWFVGGDRQPNRGIVLLDEELTKARAENATAVAEIND